MEFTKENYSRMRELLADMLIEGEFFINKLGMPINIYELLHTTTIQSLKTIWDNLTNQINKFGSKPEFLSDYSNKDYTLQILQKKQELVNLIIGYKMYKSKLSDNERLKKELESQLKALEDSVKSPEEKIAEIKNLLASIDVNKF